MALVSPAIPRVADVTNQSYGADYCTWKFGDGTIEQNFNPTQIFMQDGDYEILLIAENSSGCRDSVTKSIADELRRRGQLNVNAIAVNRERGHGANKCLDRVGVAPRQSITVGE